MFCLRSRYSSGKKKVRVAHRVPPSLDFQGCLGALSLWVEMFPAQRSCGSTVPGSVRGQVGWAPGQPGLVPHLVIGCPAQGRGLEVDDL